MVKSFRLSSNPTLEEVAEVLGDFSNPHYGHPVAIDITLPLAPAPPLARTN
jgi:hypothetical protein